MSKRGGGVGHDDYDVDDIRTVRTNATPGPVAQGVRVEVIKGPDAGVAVQLARRVSVIGRSEAADFRLSDKTVSSFHVELSCAPYGIRVTDLESANGTLYAGARVERAIIPSGAMLNVGRSVIRIDVDVPFAPDASKLPAFGELRGSSVAMRELLSMLERLARTDLSILVEGPTGTGKELVARALHDESTRRSGPLVVLDCTAIPASLAESTLFGHEKGAFTGASERRVGVFEAAEKGTIFLDEIGELPLKCDPADRDTVHTKFVIADVSLGVALVTGGIAAWLFLRKRPLESSAPTIGFTPLNGGGVAVWGGAF